MLDRFTKLVYTLKHRAAFLKIEKQLLGRVTIRGILHDFDKVILYPVLGVELTSKIHRATSRHHNKRARTRKDYEQMIVDWECARLTKPDKPLNAYDTLYKWYPQLESDILPILKEWGIAQTIKQ